ncbi:MAG: TolC family protein, partial [Betaproteobacteria bacterium]
MTGSDFWRLPMVAAVLVLAGCASFSKDGGFDSVSKIAAERLDKRVVAPRSDREREDATKASNELLARALTADDAVQVALLNNRGIRVVYADLGIAEADVVQAGRLPNPRFRTTRTRADASYKYETALTFPIAGLLTMPAALRMERERFEAVQLQVADRVLQLAAETRRAWVVAVAADEAVRYRRQVLVAAETGAELAKRMAQAGNFSRLDRMREQAFHADAVTMVRRAEGEAYEARERLARLMGLEGAQLRFTLPERLPDLPAAAAGFADIEAFALTRRLDVAAAKRDAASTARALGLTKVTRFINALELGPARVAETNEPLKRGYEISIELPIFDWGGARVAKAQAQYMQAADRVAEAAVNARSEVRAAYASYAQSWDIARHYRDEIVPLRRRISEENALRYNGMLTSVFELLADAREQVMAASGYIESLRDYWLAEAELQRALGGRLPADALTAPPGPSAPAAP